MVILASRWSNYKNEFKVLEATIRRLKESGIHRIAIIGDVPNWRGKLPKELIRYWLKRKHKFPSRLKNLDEDRDDYGLDRQLSEIAQKNDVQ